MTFALTLALLGVAISVGLGAIGSSLGVGYVAKVGASLLSKEPQKYPQVLILSALPSTQAIYGLLFGFLIIIRIGLLNEVPNNISESVGYAYLFSSIPLGLACLASGIMQGQAAASGVKILAQKPENLTQAIVLAALIESFAIFGLVISLLVVLVGIK
ncbi:MAG: V-type ATP synthase subunit K [Patescibacteria group bacterium]